MLVVDAQVAALDELRRETGVAGDLLDDRSAFALGQRIAFEQRCGVFALREPFYLLEKSLQRLASIELFMKPSGRGVAGQEHHIWHFVVDGEIEGGEIEHGR